MFTIFPAQCTDKDLESETAVENIEPTINTLETIKKTIERQLNKTKQCIYLIWNNKFYYILFFTELLAELQKTHV